MRMDNISSSIAPRHAFSIAIHLMIISLMDAKRILPQLTLTMSQNLDSFVDRNRPCQLVFSIQVAQAWLNVVKQIVPDSNPYLYVSAANVDETSPATSVDQSRFLDFDIPSENLTNAINGPVIFPSWVLILVLFVVGLMFLVVIIIDSVLFSRCLR